MKKLILWVALVAATLTSFSSFGGRDGLQMQQQEQQNKRVVGEKQKQADMQAMMDECMKMMKK